MTQDYITGYINSLNNLLYCYRIQLSELRKFRYHGRRFGEDLYVTRMDKLSYNISRQLTLKNINNIKGIKKSYAQLVKNINNAQK